MGIGAKIIVSAARGLKRVGIIPEPKFGPVEEEIAKAERYNRRHAYQQPRNRKGRYETRQIAGRPCLVMHPESPRADAGAIVFLHGGGDRDTWKPEASFARRYANRTGATVFYPIYAPMTEVSLAATADYIHLVYRQVLDEYGPGRVAVVGDSYGGFLALQLITWINREGQRAGMPSLVVLNSPFAFPETQDEQRLARKYAERDPFVPADAFDLMLGFARAVDPQTPDCLLYPMHMDFRDAPETYAFFAEEACASIAGSLARAYERDDAGERLHLHIEPGMVHCYACAPVFAESRRDFNKEIELLRRALAR